MPDTPRHNDESLPRSRILRRRSEFEAVRREGKRLSGFFLLLNYHHVSKGISQMGVVVSKNIGSATVRNRVKRQVREAYRHLQNKLPHGLKSIWVAKRFASQGTFQELQSEMVKLYTKAELLKQE